MSTAQTRRRFLTALSLAGAASLLGAPPLQSAEGRLETTTVRLVRFPGICIAPQYVAEEFLRGEGFTEIRYVDAGAAADLSVLVGRGDADFTLDFAAKAIQVIGNGGAVTLLGGVHVGCWELLANDEIHSVADLKGRRVGM